jgi:hypothetical protein
MKSQEKNLEKLLKSIGNVEITDNEMKSLEWLSGWEISTIDNICNVLEKMKSRGAGRKQKVDVCAIRAYKKGGCTQEFVARQLNVSISTIRRNWNT